MKVLITGCAGFIGYHLCSKMLNEGYNVFGVDNLNSYYDVNLKKRRLSLLKKNKNFKFKKIDISNFDKLKHIFKNKFEIVINLAAQAGVRYSLKHPNTYINSNILGFYNILELVKKNKIKKVIYASSSSVYGANKKIFFSEKDLTESQISLYAATKKTNEILANFYSRSFDISVIGLRFFTVYGPWGRPDMAIFSFTKAIKNKKPIYLNNFGNHSRDFTYIDDCIESVYKLVKLIRRKKINEIVNIAGGRKVHLLKLVKEIEKNLKTKAIIKYRSLQFGDVKSTQSNNSKLKKLIKFYPKIKIELGLKRFFKWYFNYHS